MFCKYCVLIVGVILQSNAIQNHFNYVVDNAITSYNAGKSRWVGKPAFNFPNMYRPYQGNRVKIQLYYECLCPDCRDFDTHQFSKTVQKLGPYLDIHVYPYGNAQTIVRNGHYEFICQHGPEECYGNKLHACAIDYLRNTTAAVFFNACMMDYSQAGKGSDDAAADVCGRSMNINSEIIKQCAKSDRGSALLKFYGDESKKANFHSVPYILINGVENDGNHFMQDVCKAFANPPPQCSQLD